MTSWERVSHGTNLTRSAPQYSIVIRVVYLNNGTQVLAATAG
ncbi:MAG: hypothetical protein ACP5NG_05255 [Conexivisphaera sp.]